MAVETAAMVRKDPKTGRTADSKVKIGTCTGHKLRLMTATVILGLLALHISAAEVAVDRRLPSLPPRHRLALATPGTRDALLFGVPPSLEPICTVTAGEGCRHRTVRLTVARITFQAWVRRSAPFMVATW